MTFAWTFFFSRSHLSVHCFRFVAMIVVRPYMRQPVNYVGEGIPSIIQHTNDVHFLSHHIHIALRRWHYLAPKWSLLQMLLLFCRGNFFLFFHFSFSLHSFVSFLLFHFYCSSLLFVECAIVSKMTTTQCQIASNYQLRLWMVSVPLVRLHWCRKLFVFNCLCIHYFIVNLNMHVSADSCHCIWI